MSAQPLASNADPVFPEDVEAVPGRRIPVGVAFVVGTNGVVEPSIIVWSNPNENAAFREAVKRAILTWRYAPALKNGVPVRMGVRRKFEFIDPAVKP